MLTNKLYQRLFALPAACVPAAHEPIVGRRVFVAPLAPAAAGHGTSVSAVDGGAVIPVAQARFTGEARGVPPRGRPV